MTERRIWASGILAILLLTLLCTWRHYPPPATTAQIPTEVLPSAVTSTAPAATTQPATAQPAAATAAVAAALPEPSLQGRYVNGRFTLSGSVPNQSTKDGLLSRATAIYGANNIDDQLQVADTAEPDWFKVLAAKFPPDLRGLASASINGQGSTVTLEGEAADEADRVRRGELLAAALGNDIKVDNKLAVRSVAAASSTTSASASASASANNAGAAVAVVPAGTGSVRFVTASAKLTPKARVVLQALAQSIKSGDQSARYQITGFTDSRGGDALNQKLSERRAKSVEAYLTKLGISSERFEVSGKSSAEPVGDNQTVEGRRENRRVEVRLI